MKFLFRHKKWIPCMILIISFPLFTFSATAYSEEEIIQKLQTFSMPQSNIISFCIRGVLWFIANLLRKTLDMLEQIVFSVNSGLNGIFKFQAVIDLEEKVKYLTFEYMIKKQTK